MHLILAGDQKIHINVDADPVPFLGQYAAIMGPRPVDTDDGNQIINEDPSRDDTLELLPNNLRTTASILLGSTNSIEALCDIHTALCPLV